MYFISCILVHMLRTWTPRLLLAGLLLSLGLLAISLIQGPNGALSTGLLSDSGSWLRFVVPSLTPITTTLLVLVTGVGAVVAAFARQAMASDARSNRFFALLLAACVLLCLTVTTPSIAVFALGWIAAGQVMIGLVGLINETPGRDLAVRRLRWTFGLADFALVTGLAVLAWFTKAATLRELTAAIGSAPAWTIAMAACLIAACGVLRSALAPAHRWLPETAVAATPVSAFLHAGFVNGLGVLVLTFWAVFAAQPAVLVALVFIGLGSVVIGTLQMWGKPDIKGQLASSTTSQMGFMAVELGAALPGAALLHMVGHGLYKASLFLGSASAIARRQQSLSRPVLAAPTRRRSVVAALIAVAAGVLVTVLVAALSPWTLPITFWIVVGVAGFVTAAAAAHPTLARISKTTWRADSVRVLAIYAAQLAYVFVAGLWDHTIARWLTPSVSLSPLAVGLVATGVAAALATLYGIDRAVARGRLVRLEVWATRSALRPRHTRSMVRSEVPPVAAQSVTAADRARVRAQIQDALEVSHRTWPLQDFVAVNPLGDWTRLPFAQAVGKASLFAPELQLQTNAMRVAYDSGRITDSSLATAIERVAPQIDCNVVLGSRNIGSSAIVQAVIASTVLSDVAKADTNLIDRVATLAPWHDVPATSLLHDIDLVFGTSYATEANDEIALWAAACTDANTAHWSVDGNESLWQVWRTRAHEGLDRLWNVRGLSHYIATLPERADEALSVTMQRIDITGTPRVEVLTRYVSELRGWHSVVRETAPEQTVELLAMRSALDTGLGTALLSARSMSLLDLRTRAYELRVHESARNTAQRLATLAQYLGCDEAELARVSDADLSQLIDALGALSNEVCLEVWLSAAEEYDRSELLASLDRAGQNIPTSRRADMVFCIDVREHETRRAVEAIPGIRTLGFAGFFGLPMAFKGMGEQFSSQQCPVLLSPRNTLTEWVRGSERDVAQLKGAWRAESLSTLTLDSTHGTAFAGFAFAEAAGLVYGVISMMRSWAPAWVSRVTHTRRARRRGNVRTVVELQQIGLNHDEAGRILGFRSEEQARLAETALRMLGLTQNFADTVWFVGHTATTSNNPFDAGYQCGACGGHGGAPNARALASMLNNSDMRGRLARRGINIPQTTVFVAAEHNTTTDTLTIFDADTLPQSQRADVAALHTEVSAALQRAALLRLGELSPVTSRHPNERAADWSELIPEWGLAGNKAIIVGPRSLTKDARLGRQVFLHEYNPTDDPDDSTLETILTAPVIVASWINAMYNFAAFSPLQYGAGTKLSHNVTASTGVVWGPRGDIRQSLPREAVAYRNTLMHEPRRLLVVVRASRSSVDRVVARHAQLVDLLTHRWLALTVIEDDGTLWRRETDGSWTEHHVADAQPVAPAAPKSIPATPDHSDTALEPSFDTVKGSR